MAFGGIKKSRLTNKTSKVELLKNGLDEKEREREREREREGERKERGERGERVCGCVTMVNGRLLMGRLPKMML